MRAKARYPRPQPLHAGPGPAAARISSHGWDARLAPAKTPRGEMPPALCMGACGFDQKKPSAFGL